MVKIKAFYVKENDKPSLFKQTFNIVKVENNEIAIQPNLNEKQIGRVVKKINKSCKKCGVGNVVLSKSIRNNKQLINLLIAYDINIFDGRWLINYMAYEVIDFIIQKTNRKKEETEITILTNELTNEKIENIKLFTKEFKRINIVTNHIKEFKYLEKKIYDEYGMMITVTNNKRKSLAKSEIILNFDFINDTLNKYSINEEAIIINAEGDIKINKKRFNGLTVNDYEIFSKRAEDCFEIQRLKDFYLKDLLEAKIYRKDTFANIRKDIISYHFKIKELYGNNGTLQFTA